MKTIKFIIAAIITVWACSQVKAQDDLPYRPLESFNNDTVRFLDYNFSIRFEQYKGKTVADFIKDLKLPIVYTGDYFMSVVNGSVVIDCMNLGIRMIGKEPDKKNDYYITICLENAIEGKDFHVVSDENGVHQWTSEFYEAIKDFKIDGIGTNFFLFKDRRKLLEISTNENTVKLKKIMDDEREKWRKVNRAERLKKSSAKKDEE